MFDEAGFIVFGSQQKGVLFITKNISKYVFLRPEKCRVFCQLLLLIHVMTFCAETIQSPAIYWNKIKINHEMCETIIAVIKSPLEDNKLFFFCFQPLLRIFVFSFFAGSHISL